MGINQAGSFLEADLEDIIFNSLQRQRMPVSGRPRCVADQAPLSLQWPRHPCLGHCRCPRGARCRAQEEDDVRVVPATAGDRLCQRRHRRRRQRGQAHKVGLSPIKHCGPGWHPYMTACSSSTAGQLCVQSSASLQRKMPRASSVWSGNPSG